MKYLPPVRPKFVPQKCSIVIEIWHIKYLKYPSVGYDVENDFYEKKPASSKEASHY